MHSAGDVGTNVMLAACCPIGMHYIFIGVTIRLEPF